MTSVHQHHQDALEHWVVETLQEYVGIIHTLPMLVKLHEEAMEAFNSSREKDSVREKEGGREGGRKEGRKEEGNRGREEEGNRRREGGKKEEGNRRREGGREGGRGE